MSVHQPQEIWTEQCQATWRIREAHGLKSAFDYLVGEKLMTFAEAATTRTEFARELPRFVAEVRRIFSAAEIRDHLARIERERGRRGDAARRDRFRSLKELLTAEHLGTS